MSSTARSEGGIIGFFKGLLPTFEKNRMIADLESVFKEMAITKDMYAVISKDFVDIMNQEFPILSKGFKDSIQGYRNDIIGYIGLVLQQRLKEKEALLMYIDAIYGAVVVKEMMDYQRLNLLRYVDSINFFNKYARKLIIIATEYRLGDAMVANVVNKLDAEFVNDVNNISTFIATVQIASRPLGTIRAELSKMANITFSPDTHETIARIHGTDVDPLRLGYMPFVGSVTYRVGLALNLYHAKKQELAREEAEKLKLTVLMLRRKNDNITDPIENAKIQKQIDYYNNRINKLTAALDALEEGG